MVSEKAAKIGKRIQIIRHLKQLSQKEVAKYLGVSQAHLSNIETGNNNCTLNNLFKLSEIFQCSIKDFFVDFDEPEKSKIQTETFTLNEFTQALLSLKK